MEVSIPERISSDTLFHALALNGTSLLVLDANGIITWASQAACVLFDRDDATRLEGLRWRDLIQIDGQSVWDSSLDQQFLETGFLQTDGYCDAGKRGRIAMELVMYPNRDSGERLVVIRDVTERKSYEQQLEEEKQHAETLNRALQHEIGKANELAVMAERANIAKSVFLTSMSHEFRTPLNGVLGYAQILSGNESLHPDCRRAADTIERCGQHLLSIINDVLDLSKIEAGKVEVVHEPLNLRRLLTDVMDVFLVRAHSKGLELVCEYEISTAQVEWILGDAKLIRQVLINLIGNAVKFTDQGSVRLWVATESDLAAGDATLGTRLRLSVEDTGPGIERRYLDQVFEEFYQTEAFSGHKGGTGLGLAISRKLAIAMGGQLRVESELGKGSRFQLEIPLDRVLDLKHGASTDTDTQGLRFAKVDVGFIQVFSEALDSGVMRGMLESMGLPSGSVYQVDRSLFEIPPDRHANWLIGVAAGGLLSDNARELMQWASSSRSRVLVLLYVDRSPSKCESFLEPLRQMDPAFIAVEIPIHIGTLKASLLKTCSDWFERSSPENHPQTTPSEAQRVALVSSEMPDLQILKDLLQSALVGDMRDFNRKLRGWTEGQSHPTQFEARVRQWVDGFKIDELCRYLESLVYEPRSSSESDALQREDGSGSAG